MKITKKLSDRSEDPSETLPYRYEDDAPSVTLPDRSEDLERTATGDDVDQLFDRDGDVSDDETPQETLPGAKLREVKLKNDKKKMRVYWPKESTPSYTRRTRILYQCKQCLSTIYESFPEFKSHYIQTHLESQNLEKTVMRRNRSLYINFHRCIPCDKVFNQSEIGHHQYTHREVVDKICDICGRKFTVRGTWAAHMKKHKAELTGQRFKCKVCGKTFHLINGLKNHMAHHTSERNVTCEHCGKSFKSKYALKRHARIHSSVKPFSCQYCGKGFTQLSNKRGHERTHTGERPFPCELCQAAFTHKGTLTSHLKTAHGVDASSKDKTFIEVDDLNVHDPNMYERIKIPTGETTTAI